MSKMKNNTTTTATGCSRSHAPAWERHLRLVCIPTQERGNEETIVAEIEGDAE